MQNRTDLAVESYEEKNKTKINGVIVKEGNGITYVKVTNENGVQQIGKPIGEYITVEVPSFVNDTDIFDGRLSKISAILKNLLPPDCDNVLVAGLGNMDITADALGPKTGSYIFATRHISEQLKKEMGYEQLKTVSCVCTGVLGETGIESAEIIKGHLRCCQTLLCDRSGCACSFKCKAPWHNGPAFNGRDHSRLGGRKPQI